jgi:nitrate/nitrite-specific signal transduction histidine kinase
MSVISQLKPPAGQNYSYETRVRRSIANYDESIDKLIELQIETARNVWMLRWLLTWIVIVMAVVAVVYGILIGVAIAGLPSASHTSSLYGY